ncbi:hypothetical protein MTO96_048150 [Rhipicephalus appendiculatus]
MSGVCPACSEALPSDGRLLRCSECEYAYHLGNCSGWSEGTFKSKGEAGRSSWRCINCRTVKSRGPGRQGMEPELVAGLADIVRRLDALAGVPGQINELKESIQLMSDKYDEILSVPASSTGLPLHTVTVRDQLNESNHGMWQRYGDLEGGPAEVPAWHGDQVDDSCEQIASHHRHGPP